MQGILLSHFNQVKKYLHDLQQEEFFELPCTHAASIAAHEAKLREIYENYKTALSQVELLIKDFDQHKKSVRRLIISHKGCKKLLSVPAPSLNTKSIVLSN